MGRRIKSIPAPPLREQMEKKHQRQMEEYQSLEKKREEAVRTWTKSLSNRDLQLATVLLHTMKELMDSGYHFPNETLDELVSGLRLLGAPDSALPREWSEE